MKIKKISAIILAGALLASAVGMNAFAADANAKPTITVFGNEATPTEAGKEYDFSLRLANFSGNVAGMDIILTSAGAEFTGAANTTLNLVKDSNYTISTDGKTIHIVELTDEITGNETIKLTATVKNAGNITVNVKGLAKDGTTLLTATDYALQGTATVAVAPVENPTPAESVTPESGKFIPYGFLKDSADNYIIPDKGGNYTGVSSGAYREFDLPTNVITFGYVDTTFDSKAAIQFGSYAKKSAGSDRGTMCIAGDWKEYVEYKMTNNGYSVADVLSYVSERYDAKVFVDGVQKYDFLKLTFNNGKSIRIYKVKQTKTMWDNDDYIQYALRIYNIDSNEQYAAVGYQMVNSKPVFSTEIKSK